MGVWSERVVPRLTDRALRGREIGEVRAVACAGLSGRVIELGFGSGLNVRFYPEEVTSVAAVEPADAGWELSERRRSRSRVPIHRTGLDGQDLAAPDATYDAALVTFSLCTIADPSRALGEVRRVLRPGASLHFLEHGLAPDPGVVRWQHRLEPLQRRLFAGCHLTRDVPALVRDAGFEVVSLEQRYLPGPALNRPWCAGSLGRGVKGG